MSLNKSEKLHFISLRPTYLNYFNEKYNIYISYSFFYFRLWR